MLVNLRSLCLHKDEAVAHSKQNINKM